VVQVPIQPDSSAGEPQVLSSDPALAGDDGVVLDAHGDLYVAVNGQSTIVRVSSDGTTVTTLATSSDSVDFPSSLVFGTGHGDRKTLFFVNFAIGPLFFGLPPAPGPGIRALDVGIPGQPTH
jgi:sugar lactone lactonase YvrE